jgi:hypothetical protein
MEQRGRLVTPRRNNYFRGKRMDAYQFELETAYGMNMRRMLNRMVLGGGVVCGLDVTPGYSPCSIQVSAGLAIDAWGREIVVPEDTRPVTLPQGLIDRVCGTGNDDGDRPPNGKEATYQDTSEGDQPPRQNGDEPKQNGDKPDQNGGRSDGNGEEPEPGNGCVTVVLCYHECESDPVDVLAGACGSGSPCVPGSIREQYRISFEEGCQDPYDPSCRFPDVLRAGKLDYAELARFVTRECPDSPKNPCVPLANLHLKCTEGSCEIDTSNIDITIRPVVFANAILFDLLSRIVEEEQSESGEGWRR